MTNHNPPDPKRRALGKGLESLLPARQPVAIQASAPAEPGGSPLEIPVESIDRNPFQTRTTFDPAKLTELSQSIAATGVVQPIVVKSLPRRPFPAHHRRAPPPRVKAGRQAHHPRHRPPSLRRAGHGDDDRRKPPARRPQPHGAGARLSPSVHRLPHDPGADGRTHRQGARLRRQLPPASAPP